MEELKEYVRQGDEEGTEKRVRLLLEEGSSPESSALA